MLTIKGTFSEQDKATILTALHLLLRRHLFVDIDIDGGPSRESSITFSIREGEIQGYQQTAPSIEALVRMIKDMLEPPTNPLSPLRCQIITWYGKKETTTPARELYAFFHRKFLELGDGNEGLFATYLKEALEGFQSLMQSLFEQG